MDFTFKEFYKRLDEINCCYRGILQLNTEISINKQLRDKLFNKHDDISQFIYNQINDTEQDKELKKDINLNLLSKDIIYVNLINDDFMNLSISNFILMIYNLIESTVTNALVEIHAKLKDNKVTYINLRKEIQNLWFSNKFDEVCQQNASFMSYSKKAREIVDCIVEENFIVFNSGAQQIASNLDTEKINKICLDYGIDFGISPKSDYGVLLTEIKNHRNHLAHGSRSFDEVGKKFPIDLLYSIKNETIEYLKRLLSCMKKYYDDNNFLDADKNN